MASLSRDLKGETKSEFALVSTAATAGGSGDNTEVDGATINRATLAYKAESIVFEVPLRAVLGAGESCTLTANLQDSADGSTWADITTPAVILTISSAGGGTVTGVGRLGYNLTAARQYVRSQATPNLSRANTDTAVMGAGVAVFGGIQNIT
jgi:hypothetical protein